MVEFGRSLMLDPRSCPAGRALARARPEGAEARHPVDRADEGGGGRRSCSSSRTSASAFVSRRTAWSWKAAASSSWARLGRRPCQPGQWRTSSSAAPLRLTRTSLERRPARHRRRGRHRRVTGPALAAAAGLGFGVFKTLNRRAVGGDEGTPTWRPSSSCFTALAVLVVASSDHRGPRDCWARRRPSRSSTSRSPGVIHFSLGWTLLNMSQMRIGAARSSPLLATTPVFGAVIAISDPGRRFRRQSSWLGVGLVTAGALVVSLERVSEEGWGVPWLRHPSGARHCARLGDQPNPDQGRVSKASPSPLLGLTLGMVVAVLVYAIALPLRPARGWPGARLADLRSCSRSSPGSWSGSRSGPAGPRSTTGSIAVVLALGLLSVPVVLLLSPLLMGRHVERVTLQIWLGAALVVVGGLVLVFLS